MRVHIVGLGGGFAAIGSPTDVMAVSRAWSHGFSGMRKFQSLHHPASGGAWPCLTAERFVQQSPTPSKHLRFLAQAAALEETSDVHERRRARLSREERYALVESFVVRHKDAHEGKWPSVNAIVKEVGGSRLIVKDIVEELEKNARIPDQTGEPSGSEKYVSKAASDVEELGSEAASDVEELGSEAASSVEENGSERSLGDDEEREDEETEEEEVTEAAPSEEVVNAGNGKVESTVEDQRSVRSDDPPSSSSEQQRPRSGEVDSSPGLWRRLRNLGQPADREISAPARQASAPIVTFDSYDSDLDDDEEDEDEDVDFGVDPDGGRDLQHRESSERRFTPSNVRPSPADTAGGENYGMFIRFLPLAATEVDLRAAFQDCGEIVRAQAMMPKGSGLKFTYGFVDFTTAEALAKALAKERVQIRGSTILTEECSTVRRTDSRATRAVPEHGKKPESSRPVDTRTSLSSNRPRRTGSENGSKPFAGNGSLLVVVEGLPYPMPISAVEKMLSAHGDVARSELARENGGTYAAHVEFKTQDARENALAAGRLYLAGRWCRVTTGEPILTTVVRLLNIGPASESLVLQKCSKLGRVEHIVQRKEGVVDVHYHPSERRNMRRIIDRLGEVTTDFRRWHANVAPKCSSEELRSSAQVQDWAEVQKDKLVESLTGAMKLLLIDLEDLRDLIDADRGDASTSSRSRLAPPKSLTKSPREFS